LAVVKGIFVSFLVLAAAVSEKLVGLELSEVNLGSDHYEQREEALQLFWEEGEEAESFLKEQLKSGEPEVVLRARQLLRWIDLKITPETPREIQTLVEAYIIAAAEEEREEIYKKLYDLEAYDQLYKLPNHIADQEVSQSLRTRVAEQLSRAIAEGLLLEGKEAEALQVLRAGAADSSFKNQWIPLASAMGLREPLWEGLSPEDQMRFARWDGDVELVEQLAEEEDQVRTTLQMLAGDPLPFIQRLSEARGQDRLVTRARLALASWQDGEEDEDTQKLVRGLVAETEGENTQNANVAYQALARNGYLEEALNYYRNNFKEEAFQYHQSQEELDEAFSLFGLKPGEKVSEEWIEESLKLIKEGWDRENNGCQRMAYLGMFLNERGEEAEAERIFRALLAHLGKVENESGQLDFLLFLAGTQGYSGTLELVIKLAEEMEGNVFAPRNFLISAVADDKTANEVFFFVEKQEPEMSEWDRVRVVFAFFGRRVDLPAEKVSGLLESFVERVKEDKREPGYSALRSRGDVAYLELALQGFLKLDGGSEEYLSDLAQFYFSDGRYQDAAELWERLVNAHPMNRLYLGYAVVCLTLSENHGQAEHLLNRLEKFAHGSVGWMLLLSQLWDQSGDYERSYLYAERALLNYPAGSAQWGEQLSRVAESARLSRRWKQAAACQHVYEIMRNYGYYDAPISPSVDFESFTKVEYCRGMAALEDGEEDKAIIYLDRACEAGGKLSIFADETFYTLRQLGRDDLTVRYWKKLKPDYLRSLELYPDGHNTLNVAAWVASRSGQELERAMEWSNRALQLYPNSAAYNDTKAEVFFAQGKREEALKWSEKACQKSRGEDELRLLRGQYRHFRDDPIVLTEKN